MSSAIKFTEVLKTEGVQGLLSRAFKKIVYRRYTIVLVYHNLHNPRRKFKTSKRWEIREFTEKDLQHCGDHFGRYMDDYVDLLRDGKKAFGAFKTEDGELISIAWYAPEDFYDKYYHRYTFKVAPHQVFQFAGEVAPDFRNTQVSVNVMHAGWDYWREQGKDEVLCSINVLNAPSLKLVFHLDWEEAGKLIHFHRLFRFEWQTEEPYEGERFQEFKRKRKRAQTSEAAG